MNNNIVFSKIWQDNDMMQLKAICSSCVITVTSLIYVTASMIYELIDQINQFLDGNIKEAFWANEEKGNFSTACLSLRFFKKDELGHIVIEVFAEIDDGGNYSDHNCCFFVYTEYGLLMDFCKNLIRLNDTEKCEIQLNTEDGSLCSRKPNERV